MTPAKRKTAKARIPADIYRIKVTLRYITPPIWRHIEVPADTTLGELHEMLQVAMGWTNSHLHAFRAGRESYGAVDPDFSTDMEDERGVRLDEFARKGRILVYEYDFGDGWEHDLKIEKILQAKPGAFYPRCLAGERACPPEDCGGPPGYVYLLEVLNDPDHEEYEETLEWVGEEFDPAFFDLDEVNADYAMYFDES